MNSPLYDNIPQELKVLRQWVCFSLVYEENSIKPKKIPINPHNGSKASHSNSKTWGTFQDALKACEIYGYNQIGFAFTENDPYAGIDIDNCISSEGTFNDIATKILNLFEGHYVEYSVSKKGLHIILKGNIGKGKKNQELGLEIYSQHRFFITSGNVLQSGSILEGQPKLDLIKDMYFKKTENKPKDNLGRSNLNLIDDEIIEKASNAKNGLKFISLFNGNIENYKNDHSSADLALCCLLAFWTKDIHQIDRVFRRSGLYREKWNRQDYREQTIIKAIESISNYKSEQVDNTFDSPKNSESSSSSIENHKTKKFNFIAIREMLKTSLKPKWLVKSYVNAKSFLVLFGEAGSMKSFLAIDIGLSIATGKDWHGLSVMKGPVLYIAGEGLTGISKRLKAWGVAHNIDLSNVAFSVSNMAGQFLDDFIANQVEESISRFCEKYGKPLLVIIDTLNRNFGPGDENLTKDMTIFINRIDRLIELFDCSVLIIHHSGITAKNRARGSCALRGAADWEYLVEKKLKPEKIILTSTKVKDHEPPDSISFSPEIIQLMDQVDDDEKKITSCVLRKIQGDINTCEESALSKICKKVLDALKEVIKESRKECIHVSKWRSKAYDNQITTSKNDEAKKKAFNRAKKVLVEKGYIKTDGDHCWIIRDKEMVGDS